MKREKLDFQTEPQSAAIELVLRVVTLGGTTGRRAITIANVKVPERFISRRIVALLAFVSGNVAGANGWYEQILALMETL